MSRSELHNWECAIERLCGDKTMMKYKMLAIAQDIYNTAFDRGKNYMTLEQTELNPSYNGVKSELEPCEDCISREEAVNALRKALYNYEDKTEKQFKESNELNFEDWFQHRIFVQNMNDIDIQTILELPSVTPSYNSIKTELKPSEDHISREAVMKCFKKWQPYMATRLWNYEQELKDLPSVTPTISDVENNFNIGYNCGYADAMCDISESEDTK